MFMRVIDPMAHSFLSYLASVMTPLQRNDLKLHESASRRNSCFQNRVNDCKEEVLDCNILGYYGETLLC